MKKEMSLILTVIFLASQALAFEFCDDGTVGENNIRLISVDDMLKENAKMWTWESLQKIELEARVENKNDEDGDYAIEAIFKDGENTIKIAQDSNNLEKEFFLDSGERKSVSLEFETREDLEKNTYDLYLKFYKKGSEDEECVENSEEKVTIEKVEVCDSDEVDEDELEISNIEDRKEDNENSWQWTPLDNIEISLDLENKEYSERDFTVELIFLDEDNREVDLADNSDDMIKEQNLDKNELEDIRFNFRLRPDISEAKYTLYAKAYDSDNDKICTSLKAESKSNPISIKVNKLERKVIITEVEGESTAETSSTQTYTAKITNLGSEDEDKALAIIYNRQLNIMEKLEVQNLESGEEREVVFNVQIPDNVSLQKYAILFSTEYEYRASQDYYRSASDDEDDIKYYVTISQGEMPEPTTLENETSQSNETTLENETSQSNETIIVENVEDKGQAPTTIMTGNVVGTSNEEVNWIIIIGLLILAIIGIILFFKKPPKKKSTEIEPPKVIRRYTAKLD